MYTAKAMHEHANAKKKLSNNSPVHVHGDAGARRAERDAARQVARRTTPDS